MERKRIFLSPPHMGGEELSLVHDAFASNYIAPLGPQVNAFEKEFSKYVDIRHCVALTSGTAAMHLSLRHLCITHGDEVFASTLTFIGSVTPVVFEGAVPVFIDCGRESWNMDVDLLEAELERCAAEGRLPKAVIPTDLYGQCCDLGRIVEVCDRYGVPVICDSAEAVGAKRRRSEVRGQRSEVRGQKSERATDQRSEVRSQRSETTKRADHELHELHEFSDSRLPSSVLRPLSSDLRSPTSDLWLHAGVGAKAAAYSFNGNKIMTTSGGGMLASDDEELIAHARKLSQQAREDFPHYEHVEIGYNYRMSNVLAAIGRGQLRVIEERVQRKREIFEYYKTALGDLPGIEFMPEPEWSRSNRWLTVVLITPEVFGASREQVRLALHKEDIEARPVWKPMHLQPVFNPHPDEIENRGFHGAGISQVTQMNGREARLPTSDLRPPTSCRVVGGEVAEDLFNRGLCLPSGTAMTNSDLDRVIETVLNSRPG